MNKGIIVFVVAVLLLVPSVMAATYTVEGNGSKSFTIPTGQRLDEDPTIVINNASDDCEVRINNKNWKNCTTVTSFNDNDFNDQYSGKWWNRVWNGDNDITFIGTNGTIDNFTLTYKTRSAGGGCSSSCPINFNEGTTGGTLCSGSAIPVSTQIECGSRNDYNSVDIEVYLGSTLIDPDCDVNGDAGWDGDCEINIPVNFTPGAYELKAEYSFSGRDYSCVIDSSFDVTTECSTTSACAHAGRPAGTPIAGVPTAVTGEMKVVGGDYYVAPGTEVRVSSGTVILHCSNGVTSSGRPGLVAWTDEINTGAAESHDSITSCDIVGKVREDIIGSGSITEGFRPAGCDLHWNKQHAASVLVSNFNTPGYYKTQIDAMYSICDSPDYICPDLQGSYSRSSLCNVGNFNTPELSDGWKVGPEFNFVSVNPDISFVKVGSSQNGTSFSANYEVTNIGVGAVTILDAGASSSNVTASCLNCPMTIDEGDTRIVTIAGLLNVSVILADIPNVELPFAEECSETGKISFDVSSDVFIEYDDGYSFSSIIPQNKTQSSDLVFDFDCDAGDPYVNIIDVECGDHFDLSDDVVFEVTIDDTDGLVRGYVDFGNGYNVTDVVSQGSSFLHKYSAAGTYQVVAFAEDMRGGFQRRRINMIIVDNSVDGQYVAACIKEPEDFSNMEESEVTFDASTTKAVEVISGVQYVTFPDDDPTRFSWYWRFVAPNNQVDDVIYEFTNTADSLAYRFAVEFPVAGDNSAILRVEFH